MIYYRPTDGDPSQAALTLRPRTCFLMTQIGPPLPPELTEIHDAIGERAPYFTMMGQQLERNPLLAIDYHRRAFLLSADEDCKACIEEIRTKVRFEGRAMNSVEMLATQVLLARA